MKKLSQSTNRTISLISLGVFIVSILLGTTFGIITYRNYRINQELILVAQKEQEEAKYVEWLKKYTVQEGTLVAFSDEEMIIYGEDIIIIK